MEFKYIPNEEIPADRISYAEGHGTWGGHGWQDYYARQPLEWADSEIRGFNSDLKSNPGNLDLIRKRDLHLMWRNAYLVEYNSFNGTPMDPELDKQFGNLLMEKIGKVYENDDLAKDAALKGYDAFIKSRQQATEMKSLPFDQSGIVGIMR